MKIKRFIIHLSIKFYSRCWFKSISSILYCTTCFRQRSHFWLKSNLQRTRFWHLENHMKKKIKFWCHKISSKTFQNDDPALYFFEKTDALKNHCLCFAHFFFLTDFLLISNYTILCSWRRIYLHIRHFSGIENWNNWWIEIEMLFVLHQIRLLLQNDLLGLRYIDSCLKRDGRRRLRPPPDLLTIVQKSYQWPISITISSYISSPITCNHFECCYIKNRHQN